MPRPLRFRPALLRSAALFAASAAAGPVFGQVFPPGATPVGMPPGAMAASPAEMAAMAGGDPFAGGAYAVPTAGPVAVAYGDPATLSGGTISPAPAGGTALSGPMPSGNQVFMAPQVVGSPMPGSPGCNCGPGGSPLGGSVMGGSMMGGSMMGGSMMGGSMMMDPSMGGVPFGTPSYGVPMAGPTYGGSPCDDGSCLTGGCFDSFCGGPVDPCGSGVPICDPCQAMPPVCQPGDGGGLYHGMGGKPRCGWSTGFSWVFLKPFYSGNRAFTSTVGGTSRVSDFDHSFDLSPRVFVEWVGRNDWGIRATWFGYENDSDSQTFLVPAGGSAVTSLGQIAGVGDEVSAQSSFDFDTIDLEATQRFRHGRSLVNVGGGVRWLGYEHDYTSDINQTVVGDVSRQFDGAGPTVFAEWRRPIGSSRFSLLAAVRGSLLYGEAETETTLVNGAGVSSITRTENDDFVASAETQLGGEWSTWVGERTVMFVQLAFESQALLGVGTALDDNDDLGLHGFNTKVGFEW